MTPMQTLTEIQFRSPSCLGMSEDETCDICDTVYLLGHLSYFAARSEQKATLSHLSLALGIPKPRVQKALRMLRKLKFAKFVNGGWVEVKWRKPKRTR